MNLPWNDTLILAPMSKGSNLAYRRLCMDFGARCTMSEMVFAHALAKGTRKDEALLRRSENEPCFGVQLLASHSDSLAAATSKVCQSGAAFIDFNAGCPIREVVTKGMGARLLERPNNLQPLLKTLCDTSTLPVTVKLRCGYKEGQNNLATTIKIAEDCGVSGIVVHGRTREQRYTGAADWERVAEAVSLTQLPIVGNGDILTWYEAEDRLKQSGAWGLMLGRGALIKPWLFQEIREKRDLNPTPRQRLEIYRKLASYLLEHFGSDDHGLHVANSFLSWHLDFLTRWRYLPENEWHEQAKQHPLLQTRMDRVVEGGHLNRLFGCGNREIHKQIAKALLESCLEKRDADWAEAELNNIVIPEARQHLDPSATNSENPPV